MPFFCHVKAEIMCQVINTFISLSLQTLSGKYSLVHLCKSKSLRYSPPIFLVIFLSCANHIPKTHALIFVIRVTILIDNIEYLGRLLPFLEGS